MCITMLSDPSVVYTGRRVNALQIGSAKLSQDATDTGVVFTIDLDSGPAEMATGSQERDADASCKGVSDAAVAVVDVVARMAGHVAGNTADYEALQEVMRSVLRVFNADSGAVDVPRLFNEYRRIAFQDSDQGPTATEKSPPRRILRSTTRHTHGQQSASVTHLLTGCIRTSAETPDTWPPSVVFSSLPFFWLSTFCRALHHRVHVFMR